MTQQATSSHDDTLAYQIHGTAAQHAPVVTAHAWGRRCIRACVVLVALTACKDKACPPATSPTTAQAPAPAPRAEPKRDPAFVSVDSDQLKALCLASRLPRTYETPNTGALVLGDGKRVPWLAFTVKEETDRLVKHAPVLAAAWSKQHAELIEESGDRGTAAGRMDIQFRLCGGGEADVVVSAVFVQADGYHLVAARGRKRVEKVLPPTTTVDEAFTAAYAQLEPLLGQPATIAKHQVTPDSDGAQLTINDDRWISASRTKPL